MKVDVVDPKDNFRGMSYGDWAAIWANWLMSEDPDDYDGGDMLFLRGNVDYGPVGGEDGGPRFIDPNGIYDRTGEKGESIFLNTSIFVPVLTSNYFLGSLFEGKFITTHERLRYFINKEINQSGPIWATITRKDEPRASKLVNNLRNYRIASPMFKLLVPEESFLNNKSDEPFKAGVYDSVIGGFFIIIRSLPKGTYRIQFGGKGRGIYFTNSIYDIKVEGERMNRLVDRSAEIGTNRHNKMNLSRSMALSKK